MLEIYDRLGVESVVSVDDAIVLSHEQRQKGRIRVESDSGAQVRIFLERGQPLIVGEFLRSQCGKNIIVKGAVEPVVRAWCDDWRLFSKACYHLGNRHVKIEVGERWLRISPDHVLEDMLHQLGLQLAHEQVIFVPESGAYSHGHHHH